MNVNLFDARLSQEPIEFTGVLPHVEDLSRMPAVFEVDFGLPALPTEPGIILICGPRHYGKSTWLGQQILQTGATYGPGSAFYLNGDDLAASDGMVTAINDLLLLYRPQVAVYRLFVDEITSVPEWPRGLKRLAHSEMCSWWPPGPREPNFVTVANVSPAARVGSAVRSASSRPSTTENSVERAGQCWEMRPSRPTF